MNCIELEKTAFDNPHENPGSGNGACDLLPRVDANQRDRFQFHFRRQDTPRLARQREDGPQPRQRQQERRAVGRGERRHHRQPGHPGNGGIIVTDELFGDFEVALEMNNDFGPDSGLFLRSTEDGKAWQAMIDYHAGGNLMGIYGEGLGGKPAVLNFSFGDKVTTIIPQTNSPVALPVLPGAWPGFWRHGQWNELRARIVNNPPTITTWINGVKFMEWTEKELRHPARGGIALQVHGGGDFTKQFVRYRNIRVKRLNL